MKALITTSRELGIIATLMGIIAPVAAFAASGAGEEGSGLFVWIFLGFFALIVVGQIVPAFLLITGLAKGIVSVMKEKITAVKK